MKHHDDKAALEIANKMQVERPRSDDEWDHIISAVDRLSDTLKKQIAWSEERKKKWSMK